MDIQIGGNYKYYKCRSLLACDTGGTVYETFKEFDSSNTDLLKCKDQNQSKSGQTENIIYIVDMESESEKEKRSLVDLTTHLDDDKFNDNEMNLNTSYEPDNEVIQYDPYENDIDCLNLKKSECIPKKDLIYFPSENDDREIVQDLVDQILENDNIFILQDSEHDENINNLSNAINSKDVNDNIRKDGVFYDQTEANIQYFLTSAQNNSDSSDCNNLNRPETNEYEYDPSMKKGFVSNKKHIRKRKQIYNIKDDSCTELVNEDKDLLNKTMIFNIKSKKKKLRYNKENQRKKLQYQKRNPFANLKMNSILKGNKKLAMKVSRNHCRLQKRESTSSNDENFEPSNSSYTDENFGQCNSFSSDENFGRSSTNSNDEEVLIYKNKPYQPDYFTSFHSKHDVLQEIGAIIKLNSEFSNADYLEYVQPRERIIESDMDKLLSPTIEVEFSEILKTCQIKIKDKQEQIDCNGNDLDFHDIQKMSKSKSILSPNEIAERELFLKSAYAKKLGYENYFNTSNESIINEILFDPSLTYEEIKLDLNLLKHIEIYSKQNQLLDKSFKSVSCTLLESINEFNRFGGFVEEIFEKKKSNHARENSDVTTNNGLVNFSEANKFKKKDKNLCLRQDLKEKDRNRINSNFTFNFSNKSNLLNLDFQSKYNSLEYLNTTQLPSNPLKIKIKKINVESNEYVIDDSIGHLMDISDKKKISKSMKNIYRYTCYNCSAKFRTKRILKKHVSESHRGPYDTECEICHMKFRKSSAHKKHQPWCQKNVTHKCDICSKVYCYRASLIKHLKIHKKLIY